MYVCMHVDVALCSFYYFRVVLLHKLCVRAMLYVKLILVSCLRSSTCFSEARNKSWSPMNTRLEFTSHVCM